MSVDKPDPFELREAGVAEDDLTTERVGELIAELGPDVSWADDLPVPTPAEIRDRVRRFTPEQRAAAERDAIRVEIGDTAMSLAKALINRQRLDEAEQWLRVAEEHNVPEARELLDNQWSWVAPELPEELSAEDVRDRIIARAEQDAAEILEKAREDSDNLVDSALAKVQKMLEQTRSQTRYEVVKADLASSLVDLTRVNRSEGRGQQTPTFLQLLFALLSSWTGVPVARPAERGATMRTVRVPRGDALASLLSPVPDLTQIGRYPGLPFRVFVLPRTATGWAAGEPPDPAFKRWVTKVKHFPVLNRFPDRFTPSGECRLIVAFPHVLGTHADRYGQLLALVEHLVPDHGLSSEAVRNLAWETVQELELDTPHRAAQLDDLYQLLRRGNGRTCCLGEPMTIDAELQLPNAKGNFDDLHIRRNPAQSTPWLPGYRRRCDHQPHGDRAGTTAASEASGAVEAGASGNPPTAEEIYAHASNTAPPPVLTIDQAVRELDESGGDHLVFIDASTRLLTAVYPRSGSEHGVMTFGDMEPAVIEAVGREAVQLLEAHGALPSHDTDSGTQPLDSHEEKGEEFDEFLIIETSANP